MTGLATLNPLLINQLLSQETSSNNQKNWVWANPDLGLSTDVWKTRLSKAKESGIDAVLLEVYAGGDHVYFDTDRFHVKEDILGKVIPICKSLDMEIHTWMWTMPCNNPEIVKKHPDWYAVNGKGEPAHTNPAYVDYYKFLCPKHPEVREFIQSNVRSLASIEEIDGVHLDYVRLPDAILPEALQPNYNIVQDKVYPEYDYCYSEICRKAFKEQTGIDPLKDLKKPHANKAWRQFRYDIVTELVNDFLVPEAKKYNKMITAAVFPNWFNVYQNWHNWNLDAYLPMLYYTFYNVKYTWVKKHTKISTKSVNNQQAIYSGLYIPDLKPLDLENAVQSAFKGGAKGVSIFSLGAMKNDQWDVVKKLLT